MAKIKVKIKPISWAKMREFKKFHAALTAAEKSESEIVEEEANWVIENIYPELKPDEITFADGLYLYKETVEHSNQRTVEEEKN